MMRASRNATSSSSSAMRARAWLSSSVLLASNQGSTPVRPDGGRLPLRGGGNGMLLGARGRREGRTGGRLRTTPGVEDGDAPRDEDGDAPRDEDGDAPRDEDGDGCVARATFGSAVSISSSDTSIASSSA